MDESRFRDIGAWKLRYVAYELDEDPTSHYFGRRVSWASALGIIWIERYCERTPTGEFYYPDEIPPDKGKWVVRLPNETRYFDTEAEAWECAEAYMEPTK